MYCHKSRDIDFWRSDCAQTVTGPATPTISDFFSSSFISHCSVLLSHMSVGAKQIVHWLWLREPDQLTREQVFLHSGEKGKFKHYNKEYFRNVCRSYVLNETGRSLNFALVQMWGWSRDIVINCLEVILFQIYCFGYLLTMLTNTRITLLTCLFAVQIATFNAGYTFNY